MLSLWHLLLLKNIIHDLSLPLFCDMDFSCGQSSKLPVLRLQHFVFLLPCNRNIRNYVPAVLLPIPIWDELHSGDCCSGWSFSDYSTEQANHIDFDDLGGFFP